jgi:hypothetical protein
MANQIRTELELSAQDRLSALQKEYDAVNANFRLLSEIRFKLLGFVPTIAGVSNFALMQNAFSKDRNYWLVLVFGSIGFLITLGIAMYDQRNSELYGELIARAKHLEKCLNLPNTTKPNDYGGQFRERPKRGRRLFGLVLMGHDGSLAVIYGAVLGAWFFPIIYSVLSLNPKPPHDSPEIAVVGTLLMTVIFIFEFLRLDRTWQKMWEKL